MNAPQSLPALLAQAENWREMGRDFRSDHLKLDPGLILASLAVLVAVVVFLFVLARLMNRQEGRRVYNNPKQLFLGLCRAHDLSPAQRRLLVQVALRRIVHSPPACFWSRTDSPPRRRSLRFARQKAQLEVAPGDALRRLISERGRPGLPLPRRERAAGEGDSHLQRHCPPQPRAPLPQRGRCGECMTTRSRAGRLSRPIRESPFAHFPQAAIFFRSARWLQSAERGPLMC